MIWFTRSAIAILRSDHTCGSITSRLTGIEIAHTTHIVLTIKKSSMCLPVAQNKLMIARFKIFRVNLELCYVLSSEH